MLESTPYLLKSANWTADLSPLLSTTGYGWKAVEMSAQQVGVPSTKRRTFVACVRNHPSAEERLIRWKDKKTNMRVQPVMLGESVGREGSNFLNMGQGEPRIVSFEDPILSLTRGHILGKNYHRADINLIRPMNIHSRIPRNVHLADFIKIATGLEGYVFPPTLNRSAIATLLVDSTPGEIM